MCSPPEPRLDGDNAPVSAVPAPLIALPAAPLIDVPHRLGLFLARLQMFVRPFFAMLNGKPNVLNHITNQFARYVLDALGGKESGRSRPVVFLWQQV
jgi:hypothetical protein